MTLWSVGTNALIWHGWPPSDIQGQNGILIDDGVDTHTAERSAGDRSPFTLGRRYAEGRIGGTVELLIGLYLCRSCTAL
jgi:hypothetical protein